MIAYPMINGKIYFGTFFFVEKFCFFCVELRASSPSASTSNMAKIEEMERLLREAQAEKLILLEHRVNGQIRTKTRCL